MGEEQRAPEKKEENESLAKNGRHGGGRRAISKCHEMFLAVFPKGKPFPFDMPLLLLLLFLPLLFSVLSKLCIQCNSKQSRL